MSEKEYIERGAFLRKCAEAWGHYGVTIKAIEGIADECAAADVVSRGVYDQVKWERDMAMQQLEEHGIPFGGTADNVVEVVRCKDCIHSVQLLDRLMCKRTAHKSENGWFGLRATADKHFCSYGERKEQT